MLELKHFRVLAAIAAEGSLSAAARSLGYSQPAVTQQVQGLERALRTPIVVRSKARVGLTDAGEVLLRHGEQILDLVARAESEVEAVAGLRAGRVRLACFPSGASMVLPRALGTLTARHEGLSFTLTETEPRGAYELLRRGEVDIAVVYHYEMAGTGAPPGQGPDETATPLLEEAVHVALPVGHSAAGEAVVELADLAGSRWIAGCPDCRSNLVDACRAVGFDPDIAFETDDYAALQALAAAGLGVALLPELMLAAARAEAGLVVRRLHPRSVRVVTAVTTTGLSRVPAVARTMAALREAARLVEIPDLRE
ncbi:LysR family transcriptional regulator [Saccharopolyspora phatthalungensis]|uniref:Molybdate transport repressor ModE-like protein n=1 Tax=Saccharopolyspora phatthalungensis TaxID=664693 RepID=A0A840QGY7_9PSEU|nr:LysR family transcriptional regulator [Saccharopolyspora phatthalungensis]MBB5159371.1 molybdate transport repressor ModE-like protein [Saccharopolyspora phatthalungensis]